MTQNEELLYILKERGNEGLNSFEPFRNNHRQLPRMVNDLKRLGHHIVSINNKNTSVTYVLVNSPVVKQEVKPVVEWVFTKDGRAYQSEPPRQEALL